MTHKINPTDTYLFIVEKTESRSKTSSGLYLGNKEETKYFEVAVAGPAATVAPGTRVVANVKKTLAANVEGSKYFVTKQEDLLAVLEVTDEDSTQG